MHKTCLSVAPPLGTDLWLHVGINVTNADTLWALNGCNIPDSSENNTRKLALQGGVAPERVTKHVPENSSSHQATPHSNHTTILIARHLRTMPVTSDIFPTQALHNQRKTRCRNMVMMIAATRHHDSKTCRRQRFQPTSFTKSPFFMRMLFLRKTPGHWTVILFAAESNTNWWITMTRLPFLSN